MIQPTIPASRVTGPPGDRGWADRWDLALLALLPALAVLIVCAVTPPDVLPRTNPDAILYFKVAGQVAHGQLPYRDFAFEYPPLAVLPMVLPYLAWLGGGSPALLDYQWFFAIQNAALATVVAVLVGWIAARAEMHLVPARAMATFALVAMLQIPLVAWRFDIAAIALTVGAVALVIAGRPGVAGVLLVIGTFIKIFPLAIVPVLLAWLLLRGEARGALRLAGGFVGVGAVLAAVIVATVGAEPALSFVTYQQDRLVQIESVASSVALLMHLVAGLPVTVGYGFQSLQIDAAGLDMVLRSGILLLVVAVGGVALLAALRFRSEQLRDGAPGLPTLIAYVVAVLIALLAANKVFSAQYLLWMVPFGCLLPRPQTALLVGIAALSIMVFPLSYGDLVDLEPTAIAWLVARNALLLGLLGWILVRERPLRATAGATYGAASAVSERTS